MCSKALFRSSNVKQNRLEKQMFRTVGRHVELSWLESDDISGKQERRTN